MEHSSTRTCRYLDCTVGEKVAADVDSHALGGNIHLQDKGMTTAMTPDQTLTHIKFATVFPCSVCLLLLA